MKALLALSPRLILILAEAYEIKPKQVIQDSATIQLWCWSGLELLVHVRDKYDWDASVAVYYLAALRRALDGAAARGATWPAD